MKNINCPYCGHNFEYSGDPLRDGETSEKQCSECEKYFIVTAEVSVNYYADKADCLNGNPHDLTIARAFPIEYSRLQCSYCSHSEVLTDEQLERLKQLDSRKIPKMSFSMMAKTVKGVEE